jgi:hypothetical protein
MNKLRILRALIFWLYFESHPDTLKATVNLIPGGKSWFLVEPATIWVPFKKCEKKQIIVDGKVYVKVGGGEHAGSYICIGDEPVWDGREPNTLEEWINQMDSQFGITLKGKVEPVASVTLV